MHFRANIGEMLAFTLLPLTLLMAKKWVKIRTNLYFFLLSISFTLLILSHPGISILGTGFIFIYIIYLQRGKNIFKIFTSFIPLLIGILFSAFYSIPANFENGYILAEVKTSNLEFLTLSELLFSKWRYGLLFQGPYGELSFLLGYAHWVAIFFAIYILLFKKAKNRTFYFFTIILFAYTLLLFESSKVIWQSFSILRNMRLTYRVLSIVVLISSGVASMVVEELNNKKVYWIFILIAIGTTILNWGNRKNIPTIKDEQLAKQLPYSKERDGCWAILTSPEETEDRCQDEIPMYHIESLNGGLEILDEKRTTNKHSYLVDIKSTGVVKENTSYFPGWRLFVNGNEKEIIFNDQQYPGIILFNLDSGKNYIELTFEDTSLRKYSFYISALTLFSSGIYLIISGIFPRKKTIKLNGL